jgi:hypothetical protein
MCIATRIVLAYTAEPPPPFARETIDSDETLACHCAMGQLSLRDGADNTVAAMDQQP